MPKGTNGGVSLLGLSVSLLGGVVMGLIGVMDLYLEGDACRSLGHWWAAEMVLFSAVSGLAGSLVRLPTPPPLSRPNVLTSGLARLTPRRYDAADPLLAYDRAHTH